MVHAMSQTDVARPENPAPFAESAIYDACKAFVLAYALPALDPSNVIQGWQNRASLPPGTNRLRHDQRPFRHAARNDR